MYKVVENKNIEELWKDIEGFEGYYQVSNFGNVKSLEREVWNSWNKTYHKRKSILLIQRSDESYKSVCLSKKGKKITKNVHRLVAKAFCQNVYNKREVNHIDGNKTNNFADNLEWVTSSENQKHAVDNNLQPEQYGEKNPFSKLKESDIHSIRKIRKEKGLSHQKIADMFSVDRKTIGDVLNRKTWYWLKEV